MNKILRILVLATFFFISQNLTAQTDGDLDTTFNPTDLGFGNGDGANSTVLAMAIQSDGKIIIGGNFTTYNGTSSNHIARLNANGTLDTTFNVGTGVDGAVAAIAIQSDGKIIIGGLFGTYNGTSSNRTARLNADGTLDATFNVGIGANSNIYAIAIQSDGKIIIGGNFTSYIGTAINRIVRLNADGTLDATFAVGTGAGSTVYAIAIQSDGKIIIGGGFQTYNGTTIRRIARLNADGTLDATFAVGTGASNTVFAIAIQSDGKIIIGGSFTNYNGIASSRIARLNADGTLDTTFVVGTGASAGSTVSAMAIQSDGKIIIGGSFTSYNGTASSRIARLNADGTLDATFNVGTGATSNVNIIAIQSDGKIIIGGALQTRIGRLNADGTRDTTFNVGTGVIGNVWAMAIQSDGKIIIGGDFTICNGTSVNHIARLNTDGTLDTTFNVGTGVDNYVMSMTIQSDGKIIIGGNFISYNGTATQGIARLNTDGTLDTTFSVGTGASSNVNAMAIQSDGKIIIGGFFTFYNGIPTNYIARLNTDGTLDTTFNVGTGANSTVYATAIQIDGKIIIGGAFTTYNGTTTNRIARLNTDGTLDTTFNVGIGADSDVNATAIQSDGKIVIGGNFISYNGTSANRIARLNTDGTLDTTFTVGTGADNTVSAMAIQSDGKIIIGGTFITYNGTTTNRIARLNTDGTLDTTFTVGTGANNIVKAMAIQSNGKLLIGGDFTGYKGIGRNRVARIHTTNLLELNTNELVVTNFITYSNNGILYVKSKNKKIKEVTLFDSTGKQVYKKIDINSTEMAISKLKSTNQFYILIIKDENDVFVNKKIIF